jgi:hypothetical protein
MELDLSDLGAVALLATPMIVLILRIFVISDGASFEDLIVPRYDMDWPRGVQEEDLVPWRPELLTPPDRRADEPTSRRLAKGSFAQPHHGRPDQLA